MDITVIILGALLVLYLGKITFFYTGARKASKEDFVAYEPMVSVIVAARNEEHNIDNCLASLAMLDYPSDKLEIIVINDQSTDRTGDIIRSWQTDIPSLRYMETSGVVYNLRGKANAVTQAIEQSNGEIILTTDADCQVQAGWIRNTIAWYKPDVGCVCGVTLVRPGKPFFTMQTLDWAYLMTIASAGIGWNFPLSAVGNNMSFRRKAYEDVGGYQAVGFSVTEDFALFQAISNNPEWKTHYPVSRKTLVWSEPCVTVREVYRQKKRWGKGGLEIPFMGWAIMSVGFFLNLGLAILPFFGLPLDALLFGIVWKFLVDILLLQYPLREMKQIRQFRHFFIFEIYFYIYVTLLPFIVLLTGKVVWKDRKY